SPHRVVNPQLLIDKEYGKYHQHATQKTYDNGPARSNFGTASRNAHKPCKHTVEGHGWVGFAELYPHNQHGRKATRTCGKTSIGGDESNSTVGCSRRAAVESKPSEPENKHSKASHRNIMTGNGLSHTVNTIFTDTRPDND